jgi:oligopeptide/dipeptide ABC transporter ATP-binding protein
MRCAMHSTRMRAEPPLLELASLTVTLATPAGPVTAVEGVSLRLGAGGSLGLVGESGAGKSQLALAIPGLSPPRARVTGSVRLEGRELVGAEAATLRAVRGARIGFVFQEPMSALTPHLTVGSQLGEALRAHRDVDRAQARQASLAMLERVRVADARMRLGQYPHELSGGLRQRVMLAIALIAGPALVIADEPTSALDVSIAAGILALFAELKAELGMALLMISHDLAVVASTCDEVAVLYAGRVVEQGPAQALLAAPRHPYTAALARSSIGLETPLEGPLPVIPGSPPPAGARSDGCAFAARCARAEARCTLAPPPLAALAPGRVACYFPLPAERAP